MKTINLKLFKNPFRLSQLADDTERILNEIVDLTLKTHPTHNARLRGWQRITTKLKHNNCNYCGSMGLETPRVDSPS
ncbi:hypothetical protein FKN25_17060 [Vibrio sp. 3-2(1)]|nr:hypothetical protein [Vibrio sp. 3-2(1)]